MATTVAKVVAEAIEEGYTQVKTCAGWVGLKAWTPYGKVEGHHVQFYFNPGSKQIRESLPQAEIGYGQPWNFALGVWELR